MAGFFAGKTDKIEWILPQVVTKFSGISEVPMGRALFGGWSNSRNCMRLGCVSSDEVAAFDQENQDSGEVVQQGRSGFTNSTAAKGWAKGG
jgi:hypothetical protein